METTLLFFAGLMGRFLLAAAFVIAALIPLTLVVYFVVGAGRVMALLSPVRDAGGVKWHRGYTYTPGHAWLFPESNGVVVGLDDLARKLLQGAASITLPPVGTELQPGGVLATVRVGGHTARIPSPVGGVVTARNTAVVADPARFERDPFHAGWLLRVAPATTPVAAHAGRDTFAWMKRESHRLDGLLEARLGYAAADGGALSAPPALLLSEEAFDEATRAFLQAAA